MKSIELKRGLILAIILVLPVFFSNVLSQGISIDEIKMIAEAGRTDLQWMLGHWYYQGIKVEKDPGLAKYWFEKAVSGGYEEAKFELALLYEDEKEYSKAYNLFFSYASNPQNEIKENVNSPYNHSISKVGEYKFAGIGTNKDLKGAVEWLEKARKKGFLAGLIALYGCYGELNMPEKEFVIAKEIYDKEGLPIFLAQQYLFGRGCEQNLEIVYNMLAEMANGKLEFTRPDGGVLSCDVNSQYEAQLYMGVANYFDKKKVNHYEEAVRWLQSVVDSKDAADPDRGKAMCLLQRCYRFGRGVNKDINRANELQLNSKQFLSEDEIYKFSSHFSSSY